MTTKIHPDDRRCPHEWNGHAMRIMVEDYPVDGARSYGWLLTEDIEGYVRAGQAWMDGDAESQRLMAGSIYPEPYSDEALDRIGAILES